MNYIEKLLYELVNENIPECYLGFLGEFIAKQIIYSSLDTNIVLDAQEYLNDDVKKEMNLVD